MARLLLAAAAVAALLAVVVLDRPAAAQAADPEEGREIYRESCAMCHGGDATGMLGMHPALTGAVDRLGRDGVEVTVRNGRRTTPPMPAFEDRLSDDETDDVVAYVASLPDGPRNFGPGQGEGMGDKMMDGMMDGNPPVWMWALIVVLAAALTAVVGYLIGRGRRRS